jgi:glutathione S-transferase
MTMRIWQNPLSPHARRVTMAIHELGLDAETKIVDFAKGEHKSPEFLQHNPNGKVPVLEDNGFWLWESNAILCYLADKKPEKNMYGTDARSRAETHRWLFWESAHFGHACATVAFEKLIKPMMYKQQPDATIVAWGENEFKRFGAVLNGQLEGKQWLFGNHLSIADLSIASALSYSQQTQLDLKHYHHVHSWLERMQSRDSWKKTQPQF